MAYQAFGFDGGATIAPVAALRPAARFSATEWAVIHLAKADGIGSTRRPGRIGTLLRRLFGIEAANRLADPRLEALRQAAVLCWHDTAALGNRHVDALLANGFAFDQVALLSRHAAAVR